MVDIAHEATPGGGSVGAELQAAREAQGLSLETIAERTRIPMRHLRTIEQGGHADLPALPYSSGFVKAYAQRVGLDGAELSRRFRAEAGGVERETSRYEPYEPADPRRVPSRLIAILGVLAAVAVALGYLLWRGGPDQEEMTRTAAVADQPAAAPAAAVPAAAPAPVVAAPAAAPTGPVVLSADRDGWVKVYEASGPTLYIGLIRAGARYDVPATAVAPRIQTGRPEGLTVTVGSTQIAPLGAPSTIVRNLGLKPDELLARPGPAGGGAAPAAGPLAPATPPPAGGTLTMPGAPATPS